MIIYKHKRRKKYFNRGTKQKYIKYFRTTKQHRPIVATHSPVLNPFYILALMASLSIFFLATFIFQNRPTMPVIRFEFSLPPTNFESVGKAIGSVPGTVAKSISQITPPTLPTLKPLQAPEVTAPKLSMPKIPSLQIQEKLAAVTGAIAGVANAINPLPLFARLLNSVARIVTLIIDSTAKFFIFISEGVARIATAIVNAITSFFVGLWNVLLRLLSPLDPRPAYSASKSYFGEIFSPVRTTLRESKPFANLFGKAFVQTLRDIGAGFSVAFSMLRS